MRVVGGAWQGRPLRAPTGRGTRPTSDRAREALFSVLESRYGLPGGAHVLDAFAGSGALGIEALSRGAASAWFVERDAHALGCVRANLESLGAGPEEAVVVRGDAWRLASTRTSTPPAFSLLLLDPPYRIDPVRVIDLLGGLVEAGQVAVGAVVVYEHEVRRSVCWPECFDPGPSKRYGDTVVDIASYPGG